MDEPERRALVEALRVACAAAKRVRGTSYYARAHEHINELLDQLVGR